MNLPLLSPPSFRDFLRAASPSCPAERCVYKDANHKMGRDPYLLRVVMGRSADQPPEWAALSGRFEALDSTNDNPLAGRYRSIDPNSAFSFQTFDHRGRPVNAAIRQLDSERCDSQNAVLSMAVPQESNNGSESQEAGSDEGIDEVERMFTFESSPPEHEFHDDDDVNIMSNNKYDEKPTTRALDAAQRYASKTISATAQHLLVLRSTTHEFFPHLLLRQATRLLSWAGAIEVFTQYMTSSHDGGTIPLGHRVEYLYRSCHGILRGDYWEGQMTKSLAMYVLP